ncbi:MAG TPA: YncE family protein [Caulobacteraceae bacterium]|jgi:DNA-binding beta-propeller fold protein YncE|nr:YncE family protein [Caulobacteraceae bacterium]
MKRLVLASGLLASLAVLGGPRPVEAQTPPAYKVIDHIPGPDGGWDYASFDQAARRVYLTRGDRVAGVDVDARKVNPEVVSAKGAHAATPLPGGRLLVTNGGSDTATFFDAASGRLLASVPTGKGPDGAIYDAASGLVFVADHDGGEVVFVDPKTQTGAGMVVVGGTLEFLALDGRGHLFVNVADRSEIAQIDIKAKTVTARFKLEGCERPGGLGYVPSARVLISACGNQLAVVVDPVAGKTVAMLPIGARPDAVIVDAARKLAFIPCGGDGTLAVISAPGPGQVKVVQTVATMTTARLGTLDPKTGKLYLPAFKTGPAPAGGGRAPALPGTFEFLVVGPDQPGGAAAR